MSMTAKLHATTTTAMRWATVAAREVRNRVQYGASRVYGLGMDFKGTSHNPDACRMVAVPNRSRVGRGMRFMGTVRAAKWVILWSLVLQASAARSSEPVPLPTGEWIPGAARFDRYVPKLLGARVAVVAHAASVVYVDGSWMHTVDALRARGVNVVKVFAPEHGFRSVLSAGENVPNGRDESTGLLTVSLYGNHKKPTAADLQDVDAVVFDLQDVGARFYTYISTLTYVMESCAAYRKPLIVLDRPNPNGDRLDGPVLDTAQFKSFVGMHPVPVLYGMTIGEYAGMVHGSLWAKTQGLNLHVVPLANYRRQPVVLPVPPSPNLRTPEALHAYPSLCFFEGTPVSVGRGTDHPFERYGAPWYERKGTFRFVPTAKSGATDPLFRGDTCFGRKYSPTKRMARAPLDWEPLLEMHRGFLAQLAEDDRRQERVDAYLQRRNLRMAYDSSLHSSGIDTTGFRTYDTASMEQVAFHELDSTQVYRKPRISKADRKAGFVRPFFNRLTGSPLVAEALKNNLPADQWPKMWAADLARFASLRRQYLLYSDELLHPEYADYEPPKIRK